MKAKKKKAAVKKNAPAKRRAAVRRRRSAPPARKRNPNPPARYEIVQLKGDKATRIAYCGNGNHARQIAKMLQGYALPGVKFKAI